MLAQAQVRIGPNKIEIYLNVIVAYSLHFPEKIIGKQFRNDLKFETYLFLMIKLLYLLNKKRNHYWWENPLFEENEQLF